MWSRPHLNFDPWRHDILFYKNKSFEPRLWNLPKVWHLNFDLWRHDNFLRTFYLNNQWIAVVMNGKEQGFSKAKRIWKYRWEDEKQQMVKVSILIYGVHTIISFSINTCTKTRKPTMSFLWMYMTRANNRWYNILSIDLSSILRYIRESLIRTSSILMHTLNR